MICQVCMCLKLGVGIQTILIVPFRIASLVFYLWSRTYIVCALQVQ